MRSVAALLLAATLAALTGCSAPEVQPPEAGTSASPSATPVFASDEEALAAAEEAYTEYLRMSDRIAADGGRQPERIREYVDGDALEQELETFRNFATRGLVGKGNTAYKSFTLQQSDNLVGHVRAYVCLDISAVDAVDDDGSSVLPKDRKVNVPLEVALSFDPSRERLVITESAPWSGDDFCA
jgi:hypothetical protein